MALTVEDFIFAVKINDIELANNYLRTLTDIDISTWRNKETGASVLQEVMRSVTVDNSSDLLDTILRRLAMQDLMFTKTNAGRNIFYSTVKIADNKLVWNKSLLSAVLNHLPYGSANLVIFEYVDQDILKHTFPYCSSLSKLRLGAIELAALVGDETLIQKFIERGFVLDGKKHPSAFEIAVAEGHEECVKQLLTFPQIVIRPSLLFYLAQQREISVLSRIYADNMLKILLRALPEVALNNPQYFYQEVTPLILACETGDCDLVLELLSKSADCSTVTANKKNTVLHVVCEKGNLALLTILLRSGRIGDINAALNGTNFSGNTPLYLACQAYYDNSKACQLMIESLLKTSAKNTINAVNATGKTPLSVAVARNQIELVQMLLQAGADPNAGTGAYLPLSVAFNQEKPVTKIIQLLVDAGADFMIAKQAYEKKSEFPIEVDFIMRACETKNLALLDIVSRYAPISNPIYLDVAQTQEFMHFNGGSLPHSSMGYLAHNPLTSEHKGKITFLANRLESSDGIVAHSCAQGITSLYYLIRNASLHEYKQLLQSMPIKKLMKLNSLRPLHDPLNKQFIMNMDRREMSIDIFYKTFESETCIFEIHQYLVKKSITFGMGNKNRYAERLEHFAGFIYNVRETIVDGKYNLLYDYLLDIPELKNSKLSANENYMTLFKRLVNIPVSVLIHRFKEYEAYICNPSSGFKPAEKTMIDSLLIRATCVGYSSYAKSNYSPRTRSSSKADFEHALEINDPLYFNVLLHQLRNSSVTEAEVISLLIESQLSRLTCKYALRYHNEQLVIVLINSLCQFSKEAKGVKEEHLMTLLGFFGIHCLPQIFDNEKARCDLLIRVFNILKENGVKLTNAGYNQLLAGAIYYNQSNLAFHLLSLTAEEVQGSAKISPNPAGELFKYNPRQFLIAPDTLNALESNENARVILNHLLHGLPRKITYMGKKNTDSYISTFILACYLNDDYLMKTFSPENILEITDPSEGYVTHVIAKKGTMKSLVWVMQTISPAHYPIVFNKENKQGESLLSLACQNKTEAISMLNYLLELAFKNKINIDLGKALYHACVSKNEELFVFLLEKRANINFVIDENGTTILGCLCQKMLGTVNGVPDQNFKSMVERLVKRNACYTNIKMKETVLVFGWNGFNLEFVQWVCELAPKMMNAEDANGRTFLENILIQLLRKKYSESASFKEIIYFLVRNGARLWLSPRQDFSEDDKWVCEKVLTIIGERDVKLAENFITHYFFQDNLITILSDVKTNGSNALISICRSRNFDLLNLLLNLFLINGAKIPLQKIDKKHFDDFFMNDALAPFPANKKQGVFVHPLHYVLVRGTLPQIRSVLEKLSVEELLPLIALPDNEQLKWQNLIKLSPIIKTESDMEELFSSALCFSNIHQYFIGKSREKSANVLRYQQRITNFATLFVKLSALVEQPKQFKETVIAIVQEMEPVNAKKFLILDELIPASEERYHHHRTKLAKVSPTVLFQRFCEYQQYLNNLLQNNGASVQEMAVVRALHDKIQECSASQKKISNQRNSEGTGSEGTGYAYGFGAFPGSYLSD